MLEYLVHLEQVNSSKFIKPQFAGESPELTSRCRSSIAVARVDSDCRKAPRRYVFMPLSVEEERHRTIAVVGRLRSKYVRCSMAL